MLDTNPKNIPSGYDFTVSGYQLISPAASGNIGIILGGAAPTPTPTPIGYIPWNIIDPMWTGGKIITPMTITPVNAQ